jgi:hypothetical protein
MRQTEALAEITSLRVLLIAVGVVGFGVVLLSASVYLTTADGVRGQHEFLAALTRDFGSFFLATGMLASLWELVAKRAFLREILGVVNLSDQILRAGIVQVTDDFYRDIAWRDLIATSHNIDFFFAYGQTWRRNLNTDLMKLAQRQNVRVNVILPDPDHAEIVSELSSRFLYSDSDLVRYINDAAIYFSNLAESAGSRGSQIRVWYLPMAPVFTLYRFDELMVVSLYRHRPFQASVPTIVVKQGGSLYHFFDAEISAMISGDKRLARPRDGELV